MDGQQLNPPWYVEGPLPPTCRREDRCRPRRPTQSRALRTATTRNNSSAGRWVRFVPQTWEKGRPPRGQGGWGISGCKQQDVPGYARGHPRHRQGRHRQEARPSFFLYIYFLPEVSKLRDAVAGYENVGRLEIPMDAALAVHEADPGADLSEGLGGVLGLQPGHVRIKKCQKASNKRVGHHPAERHGAHVGCQHGGAGQIAVGGIELRHRGLR